MNGKDERLALWKQRLGQVEAELLMREQQALSDPATPEELAAIADARDRIAHDRDSLAEAYDARASERNHTALRRDVAGSGRDRAARAREQDLDIGAQDRFVAGEDRDFAAGDRSDSHDDRRRGREARQTAAVDRDRAAAHREEAGKHSAEQDRELAGLQTAMQTRLLIGQAQGLVMAWHGLSPDAAFAVLVRLSQERNVKLREVAGQLVTSAGATTSERAGDRQS